MGKTILEREIEVFQSLKAGGGYIAMIAGFDWVFRGNTPMQAHQRADKYRNDRWNEIAKPSERTAKKKRKSALDVPAQSPKEREEIEP